MKSWSLFGGKTTKCFTKLSAKELFICSTTRAACWFRLNSENQWFEVTKSSKCICWSESSVYDSFEYFKSSSKEFRRSATKKQETTWTNIEDVCVVCDFNMISALKESFTNHSNVRCKWAFESLYNLNEEKAEAQKTNRIRAYGTLRNS